MESITSGNNILLLLDSFSDAAEKLYHSFRMADYSFTTVVLEENGFLPEGVVSLFGYFLGDFSKSASALGKPLYFNQVPVPEFWQISGTYRQGEIRDKSHKRGRIFYAKPENKRLVQKVEWLDENGTCRSIDHFNSKGALYAKTTCNAEGRPVMKTHFSATGQEKVVENFETGDVILNGEKEEVRVFHGRVEFALYMLGEAGLSDLTVCYNSLSTPFFISEKLKHSKKRHILFWQEPVKGDIPGNMKYIFTKGECQTKAVFVQRKDAYEKLVELGAKEEMLRKLGYIYPFQRQNKYGHNALICTNSDQIEQLQKLIESLPNFHFHIAAITEMSAKLMAFGNCENVSLYPNVKDKQLDQLFDTCDWYFDINHADEIVSAVERAFMNNQLIFAFQETVHRPELMPKEYIYPVSEVDRMIVSVKECLYGTTLADIHLIKQREAAAAESVKEYQQVLSYILPQKK